MDKRLDCVDGELLQIRTEFKFGAVDEQRAKEEHMQQVERLEHVGIKEHGSADFDEHSDFKKLALRSNV